MSDEMRNEPNPADVQAERQEVAERLRGQDGDVHELPSSALGPKKQGQRVQGAVIRIDRELGLAVTRPTEARFRAGVNACI